MTQLLDFTDPESARLIPPYGEMITIGNSKSELVFDDEYHPWYSDILKLDNEQPNGKIYWFTNELGDSGGPEGQSLLTRCMRTKLDNRWQSISGLNGLQPKHLAKMFILFLSHGWKSHGFIVDMHFSEKPTVHSHEKINMIREGILTGSNFQVKFNAPHIVIMSRYPPIPKYVDDSYVIYTINEGRSRLIQPTR